MAVTVTHVKVSGIADDPVAVAAGEIVPSDWNADHQVVIDAIDGVPIGTTTPEAGSFTTLIGGAGSANYGQLTGGATTKAVVFQTLGTDTNIAMVLKSAGTGAIDLAAGSRGINISNGGTVTAVTRTNTGSGYTSAPTWAASAPTTAGGATASGTTTISNNIATATITSGGTGYTLNDVLTFVGGTFTLASTVTVTAVSGGVITAIATTVGGIYTVPPANPISVTGGTGTGATFTLNSYGINALQITNAGSGYVEQPTVTFSGGGGSGAAAYASVGAATLIKTLFATTTTGLSFYTPVGEQVRIVNQGDGTRPLLLNGGAAGGAAIPALYSPTPSAALGLCTNAGSISAYTTGYYSGEQFRVAHTASAVNYVQVTGSATGGNTVISAQGSDANLGIELNAKGTSNVTMRSGSSAIFQALMNTGGDSWLAANRMVGNANLTASSASATNVAMSFQTKGTGAIDLAAGSSGINISNGGTVTAITRTGNGTGYTSKPAFAITAPTTAGGIQAVVTIDRMFTEAAAVVAGGTGYTVGNTLTVVGGTPTTTAVTFVVQTVSAGAVTAVSGGTLGNSYNTLPTNPVSVTGGTGSGATFNLTYGVGPAFTITNAGSGYVEQPTVTFSGGGGSGAAAYASVGAGSIIRSLGSTGTSSLSFYVPGGEVLRLRDTGTPGTYMLLNTTSSGINFIAQGATNAFLGFNSNGTSAIDFGTNGNTGNTQLRVAHTASAVNSVQVTGAATGGFPVISAQGSDTNLSLGFYSKGTGGFSFRTGAGANRSFEIVDVPSSVNRAQVKGSIAGSAPQFFVDGTDTNIDLTLTPKGTGNVRFGTYTASILTPTGYIEIKDSGGTLRRLLVG